MTEKKENAKGDTGKRYSTERRKFILDWIKARHKNQGRGAITAAQKQFKVSYIALRRWLDAEGINLTSQSTKRNGPLVNPNAVPKPIKKAFTTMLKMEQKRIKVWERVVKMLN